MTSTSTAERPFTLLDVFTDVPLQGNALAVVLEADALDDRVMLAFARETRLSETTFVQTTSAAGADYRNRIFCMASEMPFAGHPSLGTAVAVARHAGVAGAHRYVQETGAGLQAIEVDLDGDRARASMLQEPPEYGRELDPEPLLRAIGLDASAAAPDLRPQIVSTGLPHAIVPVADDSYLRQMKPDIDLVDAALTESGAWTLYCAAIAPDGRTAHVRAFGHSSQVIEDPATGSAAGPLCAYLHRHAGSDSVTITQGVEMGRPSRLDAELAGDRIRVAGDVVVVLDGTVRISAPHSRLPESPNRLEGPRGHSSAGRAPALQAGGRRFDPGWLHFTESPQIWQFCRAVVDGNWNEFTEEGAWRGHQVDTPNGTTRFA